MSQESEPRRRQTLTLPSAEAARSNPGQDAPETTNRVAEERRRRRDRGRLDGGREQYLNPTVDLDTRQYVYRWVNDAPGRVFDKTQKDDWDPVQGQDALPVFRDGKKAILMQKRRDFHEDDKAAEQKRLDERMLQIKRGQTEVGRTSSGADAGYVPGNGAALIEDG